MQMLKHLEQTLQVCKELDAGLDSKIGSLLSLKLEGYEITFKASSNVILGQKLIENYTEKV